MRALLLACLPFAGLPFAALADGGVVVPLPDLSAFSAPQAEALLEALVTANVVSSNCAAFPVTDGEWTLITQSADLLAYGTLGLSVEDYDARFYDPAFALLDDPATCAARGPEVRGLIGLLEDLGGSAVPLGPVKG
jgi:hypothetical protein